MIENTLQKGQSVQTTNCGKVYAEYFQSKLKIISKL